MKILAKANYNNENKIGSIRVSRIVGNTPIEYILQLFENTSIKLTKYKFASIPLAISYASQYGFIPSLWKTEELNI